MIDRAWWFSSEQENDIRNVKVPYPIATGKKQQQAMQSIMLSCPSEYILGLKRFALLSAEFCSTYPIHCVLRGAQEHIDQLLARHPEERKSEAGRELTFDPGDGSARCTGPVTDQQTALRNICGCMYRRSKLREHRWLYICAISISNLIIHAIKSSGSLQIQLLVPQPWTAMA